jgi:DNA gyrase subunit A
MRFTNGDQLLGMHVVEAGTDADVLVATGGGYAKRTPADQYPVKGRGGLGVVTARIVEARGELIGALMVWPDDEVFAITSAGGVIRTTAAEIKQSGRQTMGVRLVNLTSGQTLVAIARNAEEPESALDDIDADDSETAADSLITSSEVVDGAVTDAELDESGPEVSEPSDAEEGPDEEADDEADS